VKIAEYLGSGLPIIIEKNVGGVSEVMFEQSILKGIEIAVPGGDMNVAAEAVNKWLGENIAEKREQARAYASEVYLWSSAIHVSRKMYERILSN
jgi:glycosyltransferase involved in cell wall biosynthesis